MCKESKLFERVRCKKCKTCSKALRRFNKSGYCNPCFLTKYESSPEQKKKKAILQKLWRKNHPDKIKEYSKRYYKENGDKINRMKREKRREERENENKGS